MLQYETIFVTEPTLADEEIDELLKAYEQVMVTSGGKVVKVEKWGKRRLAYPIARQEEGIYVLMVVECPTGLVKELERRYRMNDRILRHLTVRVVNDAQLGPSPIMKPRPADRDEIPADPGLAV